MSPIPEGWEVPGHYIGIRGYKIWAETHAYLVLKWCISPKWVRDRGRLIWWVSERWVYIWKSSAWAKYIRYDVPVVSTSRSFLFSAKGLFDLPGVGGPCIVGYSSIICPNASCRSWFSDDNWAREWNFPGVKWLATFTDIKCPEVLDKILSCRDGFCAPLKNSGVGGLFGLGIFHWRY